MLERILDMAAVELGIDPVELRRRNFLQPDEFPYTTVTGVTYDVGDYDAALTEALRIAGYDELRAEQAARRERGDTRQLGIGVSAYVEITAGGSSSEYSEVEVHPDGSATVKAGTSAHGQGHATAYSQLVSGELGIPIEQIRFVQSDTALDPARRWHRWVALAAARRQRRARGVPRGARAGPQPGRRPAGGRARGHRGRPTERFGVAGVPSRAVTWAEISTRATDEGLPLVAEHDFVQTGASFPFGAHVSVVEVDTETGRVAARPPRRGRRLRPHPQPDARRRPGARWAGARGSRRHSGSRWSTTTTAIRSRRRSPSTRSRARRSSRRSRSRTRETPSPLNPLGAKGIGESATVGSTPAVQNAVVDALSHLGVRHIDMPCTPERVWRAIEDARAGTLPDPWREPPAAFATLPVRERKQPHREDEIDL